MPKFDSGNYVDKPRVTLTKGIYPFYVKAAADNTAESSGNEMIDLEIILTVKHEDGEEVEKTVFDRLVFTETALWKVKGFCAATGLIAKWEAGELEASDCEGAAGYVFIDKGKKKSDGRQFMEPQYYMTPEEVAKKTGAAKKTYTEAPAPGPKSSVKGKAPQTTPSSTPSTARQSRQTAGSTAVEDDEIPF